MADSEGRAIPPVATAVRAAIEGQAGAIRDWANGEIARVEAQRDKTLRSLEQAIACLGGADEEQASPQARLRPVARRSKSRRRRRLRAATTPAAVGERCEIVLQYLHEQDRPVSRGEVCRARKLTPHTVSTALNLLCDEGKAERIGSGAATRYKARAGSSARRVGSPTGSSEEGTLQGRILATLQERGWASLDELVQAVGVPRDEVLRECGVLVRDEEIQMGRREGRSVYICQAGS